ncbi:MAG TPA: hypothetical protein VL027_12900 [Spongiibacteraceae bacterium]|jgi:hypothetical protein|nr:hypothetical protein [Spongiibacteraceae bacterium]HUH38834.1 hypothetical protein [Spongiibacteraceae bacterium]
MGQESVVYGVIKDAIFGANDEARRHRQINKSVLAGLPSIEDWPLLSREMFRWPADTVNLNDMRTDVMHFGTSYKGVEYEWEQWLATFEQMLAQMYWVSATVHLETEFNGVHTFTWQAEGDFHEPGGAEGLAVRCEWSRESSVF